MATSWPQHSTSSAQHRERERGRKRATRCGADMAESGFKSFQIESFWGNLLRFCVRGALWPLGQELYPLRYFCRPIDQLLALHGA